MSVKCLPTIDLPFTDAQIDAGAEALRQREQGGRILREWAVLPNGDKKKWRVKALTVLYAARLKD